MSTEPDEVVKVEYRVQMYARGRWKDVPGNLPGAVNAREWAADIARTDCDGDMTKVRILIGTWTVWGKR